MRLAAYVIAAKSQRDLWAVVRIGARMGSNVLAGIGRRRSMRGRGPTTPPPTIDHPQTSLGPRCAIATSTATIRGPSTIRPSTIANVSGTGGVKSRPTLFGFCTKKNYALCGNCLNLEFGLIQPLRRLSSAIACCDTPSLTGSSSPPCRLCSSDCPGPCSWGRS